MHKKIGYNRFIYNQMLSLRKEIYECLETISMH
ncbi:MAG: helix-turn-helix domain-containing protein [Promethearchaeota archaeon]